MKGNDPMRGQASLTACVMVLGSMLPGCQNAQPERQGPTQSPLTMTDPCSMRLHDLSGALLLYHSQTGRLPQSLEELRRLPGAVSEMESFNCPVTNEPYLYSAEGISVLGRVSKLLVVDPVAAHDGTRWAVEVHDSKPGSPLVTETVQIPEKFFRSNRQ